MNYINQTVIQGKITGTPELYEGKKNCLNLTVLTKQAVQSNDGDVFEIATFHNVKYFEADAKELLPILIKGEWITVEGSISKQRYKDKTYTNLTASSINLPSAQKKTRTRKAR